MTTHITALIIYESVIITSEEAKYFWSGRLTGAAVLFYLNKYLVLLSFVYTMMGYIPGMSDKVCLPSPYVSQPIHPSVLIEYHYRRRRNIPTFLMTYGIKVLIQ